jgi:hypothetical protein
MTPSPFQGAMLIWAAGAAVFAWRTWRMMEHLAERDCACSRSRMTLLSGIAQTSPEAFWIVLLVLGAAWPGLAIELPIYRWRHRHDPRCPECGMRLTPPRKEAPDGRTD